VVVLKVVKAIFRKEVLEVLRDKRTLFLAFVVPLLFYPFLFGMTAWVGVDTGDVKKGEQIEVGVIGDLPVEVKELEELIFKEVSSIDELETSVVIEYTEGEMVTHYLPSLRGEAEKIAIIDLLEEASYDSFVQSLGSSGVDVRSHQSFSVREMKRRGLRNELAMKYGTAAAYFIVFLAFTGCMSVAVDAGAGERERGTLEAMIVSPASVLGIALGKLCFVITMGLLSVVSTLLGLFLILMMSSEVREGLSNVLDRTFFLQVIVMMVAVVVLFGSVLYSVSLLAKSSREAHLRASLIMMLVAVLLIAAGSERILSSGWVIHIPLMNVSYGISQALAGDLEWWKCGLVAIYSIVLSALVLVVVTRYFSKHPERVYLSS